jgi:hypothetical protein
MVGRNGPTRSLFMKPVPELITRRQLRDTVLIEGHPHSLVRKLRRLIDRSGFRAASLVSIDADVVGTRARSLDLRRASFCSSEAVIRWTRC